MLYFPASDSTGQLALNALLERCDDVLRRFVEDERLSGSCPLPRYSTAFRSDWFTFILFFIMNKRRNNINN